MTALTVAATETTALRPLIDRAAMTLANAASAADVLDARDQASLAYDAAKAAARFEKAKGAHDEIMASIYRSQAEAAEIEFMAKRKLADEFDAAQARGEVAGVGGKRGNQYASVDDENVAVPTSADLGLTRPQIHEARQIRDAIEAQPDLLRSVLDDMLQNGEEPTKAKLRKAIAPVVTTLRADATAAKKERRKEREITLAGKIKALPDKKFGVIWADPEWKFKPFSEETGMDRAPENHYPTSETDDICARDVPSIAAKDCVLFLWATAPMLLDALRVLEAWGFEYKTHMIWAKERSGAARGPGYWFSGEHELLLIGTRGNVVAPAMGEQWRSVITARVGEHSEKPEVFLEMVEDYFPNLPKIELNRRGPARPGWDAWGNEAEDIEAESAEGGTIDLEDWLDSNPADSVAIVPNVDPLRDALIAAGFAPNGYILDLNRGVSIDGPVDLPSRLFRFPVEYMDRKRTGAESRLLLRHPLLRDYPAVAAFLDDIEAKTGFRAEWADQDEFGRDFGAQGRWWHAVDLCSDKHWQDLLRTKQFTDRDCIFGAVRIGLEHKMLALKHARSIMVDLESAEPFDRSADALAGKGLWPFKDGDKKFIAPNITPKGEAGAWLTIHGMEDGWLAYVGKYLSVTKAGMERREAAREVIPAPTIDELVEHKMLGAIEAGLVVGGDMFDTFVTRGLVVAGDTIALSPMGVARSAELDRMVKAHSDGDAVECRPAEGEAA